MDAIGRAPVTLPEKAWSVGVDAVPADMGSDMISFDFFNEVRVAGQLDFDVDGLRRASAKAGSPDGVSEAGRMDGEAAVISDVLAAAFRARPFLAAAVAGFFLDDAMVIAAFGAAFGLESSEKSLAAEDPSAKVDSSRLSLNASITSNLSF